MLLYFGHNLYDAYLNKVTIHRTQVGGAKPGGEFIFRVENGRVHFTGVLYPMVGDGGCDYSGNKFNLAIIKNESVPDQFEITGPCSLVKRNHACSLAGGSIYSYNCSGANELVIFFRVMNAKHFFVA